MTCDNCTAQVGADDVVICEDCWAEIGPCCMLRCAGCERFFCTRCILQGAQGTLCAFCVDEGVGVSGGNPETKPFPRRKCACPACQEGPLPPPSGETPWLNLSVERIRVGEWVTVARTQNGAVVWARNAPDQPSAEVALLDFLTSYAATLIQEAA